MQVDASQFMTPDAVVIYPSRGKLLLLVLGAAGFVALAVFLWNTGQTKNQVVPAASALFFGACLLFGLARLIWRRPPLVINSAGLLDSSSALGPYAVLWDEIEGVYISSMRTSAFRPQRFLSIRLKRPEEFLSRQSVLRARLMKANIGLIGAPVNISANTLSKTLEELIVIFQKRCPAMQVLSAR